MDSILSHEKKQLLETLEKYRKIIREAKEFYDAIPALYPADSYIVNALLLETHNRIAKLNRGMEKPYFARIDFKYDGSQKADAYYIGKIGVMDADEKIVTLDWRAPISSLYYDSGVGEAQYISPGGVERGSLELKRLLEVENGVLLSYSDVDTVSNDDILRPYLGVNADNRLKNIISTIQSEQNRIIRESIDENIIVQGVAGSGKTTVALHRIAYLAYNHRERINPGQYMVIGPNKFFISYISSVLPDLDVDSVPQHTLQELAKAVLHEDFTVNEQGGKLALVIKGKSSASVEGLKTSMRYKSTLDSFLKWYEPTIMPCSDFTLRGFQLLDKKALRMAWENAMAGAGANIAARVDMCVASLGILLDTKKSEIELRLSEHFKALYADRTQQLDKLHRDRAYIEKELESGCASSLRAFMKGVDVKILSLYRLFIENAETFIEDFDDVEALKKQTYANLQKKKADHEDLAALLYLKERTRGSDRFKSFRHAVVDEAQDFGEFEFFALQRILSACTFTVVGDLAQSIYSYKGIKSWDGVSTHSFERGAKLYSMVKCYRTTIEVMECANLITGHMGLDPAEPVIRHGAPVGFHHIKGTDALEKITGLVNEYMGGGFKSIAVLSKTEEELVPIHTAFTQAGISSELVTSQSDSYTGGVCLMPGYLSKGLEFDGVILCDASDSVYSSDKRIDMHLLYVAMTRPLHRLDILYSGTLPEPLRA